MKRMSTGDKVFSIVNYSLLGLLTIIVFYPFWNAVVISFNDGLDTLKGGITVWPRKFTLANYQFVFKDIDLLRAFLVSVLRTVIGTFTSILCTAIFAYGISKSHLIGRKFYMVLCVITMYFSGGLIPTYKLMMDLKLIDTFWVMVIPGTIGVWNMIIFRTFFKAIPAGLEESARIDGCSNWGIFFRIVIPVSGSVIATLALFTAVGHWNDWFGPSIYINNQNLKPIQTKLNQILNMNMMTDAMSKSGTASASHIQKMKQFTTQSLTMATMMVTTVPILLVYPFLQKYFVKGVIVGSLKE